MKENFHELNKTSSLKLSELPKLNKEITYVKLKYEVAESTIQEIKHKLVKVQETAQAIDLLTNEFQEYRSANLNNQKLLINEIRNFLIPNIHQIIDAKLNERLFNLSSSKFSKNNLLYADESLKAQGPLENFSVQGVKNNELGRNLRNSPTVINVGAF